MRADPAVTNGVVYIGSEEPVPLPERNTSTLIWSYPNQCFACSEHGTWRKQGHFHAVESVPYMGPTVVLTRHIPAASARLLRMRRLIAQA